MSTILIHQTEHDLMRHWRAVACADGDAPLAVSEFADLLGVSRQQVHSYETGAQRPDHKTLERWFADADERVSGLAVAIMTLRANKHIEAARASGLGAMTLPALMLTR